MICNEPDAIRYVLKLRCIGGIYQPTFGRDTMDTPVEKSQDYFLTCPFFGNTFFLISCDNESQAVRIFVTL